MYTLTSHDTGKIYPDTKQGRDAMDRDEERVRLSNTQLEALLVLSGFYQVMRDAIVRLKPYAKRTGTGKMLPAAVGMIGKMLSDMLRKVSAHQLRTLKANTNQVSVSISSGKVPAMVNIDLEDLQHIANRALETCEMVCTASREESKTCRLRRAFEQVPGARDGLRTDESKCPYACAELEVLADE